MDSAGRGVSSACTDSLALWELFTFVRLCADKYDVLRLALWTHQLSAAGVHGRRVVRAAVSHSRLAARSSWEENLFGLLRLCVVRPCLLCSCPVRPTVAVLQVC